jgi:hypothetical protein
VAGNRNNFTAPDTFSDAGLVPCPNAGRLRMFVNNQAIYWRRGFAPPGGKGIRWEDEEYLIPGIYSFNDRADYVQVRAAIPAASIPEGESQAQVTIATRTLDELLVLSGKRPPPRDSVARQ